jgi:hypothetical protein
MQRKSLAALGGLAAAAAALLVGTTQFASARAEARLAASCQLANGIKHVISLQFDNVHLSRDNPNVPSDLEQMPHLLSFLRQNGSLISNHHTILISHTAGGILTSLTGLYPDRSGVTVSNSYDYYKPNGKATYTSAFKYWNAAVSAPDDPLPNMVNGDSGTPKTTPAPWVPFTRAGCDFGAVSVANTVLENNSTNAANGDMYSVFGPGSPEFLEAATPATKAKAYTDFVGIAVHCGLNGTGVCAGNANARGDNLPDEPGGGYAGQALFGAKYVNPAIAAGGTTVTDLNGNAIKDAAGNPGFPGFDAMPASTSLAYVAQMQEAGIPITYAYISDVHDNHAGQGAYGPGEPGYVAALKAYDDAFAAFFQRLAGDGIDRSNTLFVVNADEGDHFAGQEAQNCDGVTTPCTYTHGVTDLTNGAATPATWTPPTLNPAHPFVGEVGMDLKWLLGTNPAGGSIGYDISFDSAPSFYIDGQPQAVDSNGDIVVNDTLRKFEAAAATAKAFDPYVDSTQLTPVANYLADAPTLKALHMINADPKRTMSFTMFAQPDYYFQTFTPCKNGYKACISSAYAYIHGDYAPDIGRTFLGLVGPGVSSRGDVGLEGNGNGNDGGVWSDHTDVQPTVLSLLGLKDDYEPDGRVITDVLSPSALPKSLKAHTEAVTELGAVYKQLDAPYGSFDGYLLTASTKGIKAADARYLVIENAIKTLTSQRDGLADDIRTALNEASFDGQALDEHQATQWIDRAHGLIAAARALSLQP